MAGTIIYGIEYIFGTGFSICFYVLSMSRVYWHWACLRFFTSHPVVFLLALGLRIEVWELVDLNVKRKIESGQQSKPVERREGRRSVNIQDFGRWCLGLVKCLREYKRLQERRHRCGSVKQGGLMVIQSGLEEKRLCCEGLQSNASSQRVAGGRMSSKETEGVKDCREDRRREGCRAKGTKRIGCDTRRRNYASQRCDETRYGCTPPGQERTRVEPPVEENDVARSGRKDKSLFEAVGIFQVTGLDPRSDQRS
ncbi:hypothetical protein B0H14DRAFT_2555105 [Mycena olivaceomarginata]|nr:hypothetical protein B0H14DRAFT_2555105 [Mycena olivaceomarginata]